MLESGRVRQYVEVQDSDYDPKRMMAAADAAITLWVQHPSA